VPSETIGVIAARYAGALYELAESQSALDTVANDLRALKAMLAASEDLRRLVRSPAVSRSDQGRAIAALAQSAHLSDLTSRFLGLAAKNRRLMILGAVIDAYLGRLAARRGEKTAHVAAAAPLSAAQIASLTAALRAVFGGSVAVDTVVDPSLLGGLVVKVDSQLFDSSLRTKLQHLKLAMKGVG